MADYVPTTDGLLRPWLKNLKTNVPTLVTHGGENTAVKIRLGERSSRCRELASAERDNANEFE